MTGTQLMENVRQLAVDQLHLLAIHIPDSRRIAAQGWSKGFTDTLIVSPAGRGMIFAEIKGQDEQPSRDQRAWGRALMACGAIYVIWRPADWDSGEIRARLLMLAQP